MGRGKRILRWIRKKIFRKRSRRPVEQPAIERETKNGHLSSATLDQLFDKQLGSISQEQKVESAPSMDRVEASSKYIYLHNESAQDGLIEGLLSEVKKAARIKRITIHYKTSGTC